MIRIELKRIENEGLKLIGVNSFSWADQLFNLLVFAGKEQFSYQELALSVNLTGKLVSAVQKGNKYLEITENEKNYIVSRIFKNTYPKAFPELFNFIKEIADSKEENLTEELPFNS